MSPDGQWLALRRSPSPGVSSLVVYRVADLLSGTATPVSFTYPDGEWSEVEGWYGGQLVGPE